MIYRVRALCYSEVNRPPPKPLTKAQMGGASFLSGVSVKPSLSVEEQIQLLKNRGLVIEDHAECQTFLTATNYYRFSGYMRYFQRAPHLGDNSFHPGTTFSNIRDIYDADEALRMALIVPLTQVELLLRTHVARVIAHEYGPYGRYLRQDFYTDIEDRETTVEACLRDIDRSRERHILRYKGDVDRSIDYSRLPVWSAVEAWSFGTLSKAIERGASGTLAGAVAESIGAAKGGFPYRIRALVYLRNRCAHHNRLWHHSALDAGPTPNNVRKKAKRLAGQFHQRSVLDIIASLDDISRRSRVSEPLLPTLVQQHSRASAFWHGLAQPQSPLDNQN